MQHHILTIPDDSVHERLVQLAATAMEHGLILVSADSGFTRVVGLSLIDSLNS